MSIPAIRALVLAILLVVPSFALARDPCHEKATPECVARQKENCRRAADQALAAARELPARGAADLERKRELVKRIETLVAERRRAGADECRTWNEVMGIAFAQ